MENCEVWLSKCGRPRRRGIIIGYFEAGGIGNVWELEIGPKSCEVWIWNKGRESRKESYV